MNIQITAYGLGGGHDGAAGGSCDDTEIKKELEAVKKQLPTCQKAARRMTTLICANSLQRSRNRSAK